MSLGQKKNDEGNVEKNFINQCKTYVRIILLTYFIGGQSIKSTIYACRAMWHTLTLDRDSLPSPKFFKTSD